MTKDQAVAYLRDYRKFCGHVFNESALWNQLRVNYRNLCYRRYLISVLIQRIKDSDYDPIYTVQHTVWELDNILGESDEDHFITHKFAAVMESEACFILRYLKAMEGEK